MPDQTALANLIDANPNADAAAILALCAADVRTATPIPLALLKPWMSGVGLLSRLRRTVASATLATLIGQLSYPLLETLDTADAGTTEAPGYAVKTGRMLALMTAVNGLDATLGMTAEEAAKFLSFGGGYALRDATGEQVTAALNAKVAAQAKAARLSAATTYYQANVAAYNGWDAEFVAFRAAIEAGEDPATPKGLVREA